jgi:hypothetical protein
MAKLSSETVIVINQLKQQSLEILDEAKAAEFRLLNLWGETERTSLFFEELMGVAEEARTVFSRFNQLQMRVAEAQPTASSNLLNALNQVIEFTSSRIPAWERSIEEVRLEFNLS